MPIGVPRVPFRSPGEEDAVWIDVQCDLSDILGIRYFPVLFPDRDIPSFARERLIQLSKIWSVKCNQVRFLGRVYGLIFSIRIIYGWLGQTNQMKDQAPFRKKPIGNKSIYDYDLISYFNYFDLFRYLEIKAISNC